MINTLATAALCLFVLLVSWYGLDRLEDRRQAADARRASDDRQRLRMRAVLGMTDRRS